MGANEGSWLWVACAVSWVFKGENQREESVSSPFAAPSRHRLASLHQEVVSPPGFYELVILSVWRQHHFSPHVLILTQWEGKWTSCFLWGAQCWQQGDLWSTAPRKHSTVSPDMQCNHNRWFYFFARTLFSCLCCLCFQEPDGALGYTTFSWHEMSQCSVHPSNLQPINCLKRAIMRAASACRALCYNKLLI